MYRKINDRIVACDVVTGAAGDKLGAGERTIFLELMDLETGNTVFYPIEPKIKDLEAQFDRERPQLTEHTQESRHNRLKEVLRFALTTKEAW